jgi:hypothetical protein
MENETYSKALNQAQKELGELLAQEVELTTRIARLKQTIAGLTQLCGEAAPVPLPDFSMAAIMRELKTPKGKLAALVGLAALLSGDPNKMGLGNACVEVLKAADGPLTAEEVKEGLIMIAYDTSSSANILASIHTTLRRMVENKQVQESTKDGKKAYELTTKLLMRRRKEIEAEETIKKDMVSGTSKKRVR